MTNGGSGRLTVGFPVACLVLAAVAAVTALCGVAGLIAYSNSDVAAALLLGIPFALLSLLALAAGLPGRSLAASRSLLGVGLAPLVLGLMGSLGLGFLSMDGTGTLTQATVTIARFGVPLTLLTWVVVIVMAWLARARMGG